MKVRVFAVVLWISFLLTGCNLLDGSYSSVVVHREQRPAAKNDTASASDREELIGALEDIIAEGTATAAVKVGDYPQQALEKDIPSVMWYLTSSSPIGSYAMESIDYELGTSAGEPALAVNIVYRRSLAELQKIRTVANMDGAVGEIQRALRRYDASIVLMVKQYAQQDLIQAVENYAAVNPDLIMEVPKVTETVYGGTEGRVIEIIFSYQNSREDLRNMQSQVEPVFNSARLYVTGNASEHQKYVQLYAFLMERSDYKVETSLTPAYSLLHHGVGSSKAFAQVYAAMCRDVGLEARTVTGTCNGEPRTWNLVKEDGCYYHVDLLACNAVGAYRTCTDEQMEGYVWDYSAYPVCNGQPEPEIVE